MNLALLDDILDPQGQSFDTLLGWIEARINMIQKTRFTSEVISTFKPIELPELPPHACGSEASVTWRRFFLATLIADWCSYDAIVDRADFSRLKYIMTSAYRYTRLWCCRLPDGEILPVGYSAWYPISKFVYEGVLENSAEINDRGIIMPLRYAEPKDIRYAYIFNVSVTKGLRNTSCSQRLVRSFQRDGQCLGNVSALAITVAEEGCRLSQMANFFSAGDISIQGETESLFVRRPA